MELKFASKPQAIGKTPAFRGPIPDSAGVSSPSKPRTSPKTSHTLVVDTNADEEEVNQTIDQKIAAARPRLSPAHCLFCSEVSSSLEANLTHMSSKHSFFVPDADYLVDLTGLLAYLREKVAVGNVCIYCNERSREFRTLDAVRKHMLDKGHCKIAYDTEDDRLEVSEYYDFTSSYPIATLKNKSPAKAQRNEQSEDMDEEQWEDDSDADSDEVDEMAEQSASEEVSEAEWDFDDDNQVTFGNTQYELVLPNGARIGHRSMRRHYAQTFSGTPHGKPEDPNSGAALVRRLLAEKNSALVPRKGGFGAFGAGTDVVQARNSGEARNAGRHVREFRDTKRRQDFKTQVGFALNSHKHCGDPFLQVSSLCSDCILSLT
jgi:pre-60S factor REI1